MIDERTAADGGAWVRIVSSGLSTTLIAALLLSCGGSGSGSDLPPGEKMAVRQDQVDEARSGRAIVEDAATKEAARGRRALRDRYSASQIESCSRTPSQCQFYDAKIVKDLVAHTLDVDRPGRFAYQQDGVDFTDRVTGEEIELVTRAQFSHHLSRTGRYRGVEFAIYQRPTT